MDTVNVALDNLKETGADYMIALHKMCDEWPKITTRHTNLQAMRCTSDAHFEAIQHYKVQFETATGNL